MTLKLTLFGCLTLNTLLMCRADLGFGYPEAQEEGLHKQNSNVMHYFSLNYKKIKFLCSITFSKPKIKEPN